MKAMSKRSSVWQRVLDVLVLIVLTAGAITQGLMIAVVALALALSPGGSGTALSQPARSTPLGEPVTILLLGLDRRPGETGPSHTDTMILVSLDPLKGTASMLSIPRDLWVQIPDYGEERINVAYFLGEVRVLPGGGPAMAKRTVSTLLGVPVRYYVCLDFAAFERIIDALGGVTINVEKRVYDAAYPGNHYGTITVDIPAGVQPMDGATALQYARSRHGSSDFERMARQQQVILAVGARIREGWLPLKSETSLPVLRPYFLPRLLAVARDSVQTDLGPGAIGEVAVAAVRLDPAQIHRGAIEGALVRPFTTSGGAQVELPVWPRINALVAELFPG